MIRNRAHRCWPQPSARLLLPLSALLLSLAGCAPPNEYQPPQPPEVTVANPLVQTVTEYLEQTGTTAAVERVKIRARVRGFIDEIKFKVEDDVHEGDVLYVIEKQTYEAEVQKAKAALAVAQAEYKNADARYLSAKPLAEKGVITREELAQREAERSVALAKIYAAEGELKMAQINLGYCDVKSPINGRVGQTLITKGNLVDGAEGTHLTTVVSYDPIYANFYISGTLLQEIRANAPRRKENGELIDKESVRMFLSRQIDGDKYPFPGHLYYWDLGVEETTGTYFIQGVFANPDRALLPGEFVKIRVPMAKLENALLVPEASIGTDQIGRYVLVIEEIDGQQIVKRRGVQPGKRVGDMQVVLDGLMATDRVVVDGIQRARRDAEVRPNETKLPPLKSDGVQTFSSTDEQGEAIKPPEPEPLDESESALFRGPDAPRNDAGTDGATTDGATTDGAATNGAATDGAAAGGGEKGDARAD